MSGLLRAPSDAYQKQMMQARATIVRVLEKHLPTVAECRSCEREIYRRSHSNLNTYRHSAEKVVRRGLQAPFAPARDIVVPESTAVSQEDLKR